MYLAIAVLYNLQMFLQINLYLLVLLSLLPKVVALNMQNNELNPLQFLLKLNLIVLYGSFMPISFMTTIFPLSPTARPTSSFPFALSGKSTNGLPTYPLLRLLNWIL